MVKNGSLSWYDNTFSSSYHSLLPKITLLGSTFSDLNERQLEFWHILQDTNSLTASIAHTYFPEVSRPTINNDLKEMVILGLVTVKGSSSTTSYVPKY